MAVSCSNCGGSHPVWDCRSKSTAARKDVQVKRGLAVKVVGLETAANRESPKALACTQAMPVDTKLGAGVDAMGSSGATTVATSAPGAKFDKKAWSREYMSGYMKQYRAEVKAGTRVPKRKGEK